MEPTQPSVPANKAHNLGRAQGRQHASPFDILRCPCHLSLLLRETQLIWAQDDKKTRMSESETFRKHCVALSPQAEDTLGTP